MLVITTSASDNSLVPQDLAVLEQADLLPTAIDQGMPLCVAEIDKVIYFSGMTDAGKFEAIRAITDLNEFLALFGINYAELKEVLALPDEHLAAASANSKPLFFDKERQPAQEKILPEASGDYEAVPAAADPAENNADLPMTGEKMLGDGDVPAQGQSQPNGEAAPLPPPTVGAGNQGTGPASETTVIRAEQNLDGAPAANNGAAPAGNGEHMAFQPEENGDAPVDNWNPDQDHFIPDEVPAEQGEEPDLNWGEQLGETIVPPTAESRTQVLNAFASGTNHVVQNVGRGGVAGTGIPVSWAIGGSIALIGGAGVTALILTSGQSNSNDKDDDNNNGGAPAALDGDTVMPVGPLPESLPQTSGLPDSAPDTTSSGTEVGHAMPVTAASGVDSGETPITSSGDTPGPGNFVTPIGDLDPTDLLPAPTPFPLLYIDTGSWRTGLAQATVIRILAELADGTAPLLREVTAGAGEIARVYNIEILGQMVEVTYVTDTQGTFIRAGDKGALDPLNGPADPEQVIFHPTPNENLPTNGNTNAANSESLPATNSTGTAEHASSHAGSSSHGGSNFNLGGGINLGGGSGGGASLATQILTGVGVAVVAAGLTGLIALAADPDGVKETLSPGNASPDAPDAHDNPAPLTSAPVADAANPDATLLNTAPLEASPVNVGGPTSFQHQDQNAAAAGSYSATSTVIADTPVTLMLALSQFGGISFADVAGELPAIRAILGQWIGNAAPDYPLALQGIDIDDYGDGAGLSLMIYLNAYVDPSTGFNVALTPESVATLQSTVQHQVEGWLHGQVVDVALMGASASSPIV